MALSRLSSKNIAKPGSIEDITARILLWSKRPVQSLARIEFISELARAEVISKLKIELANNQIPFHEISLPLYQSAAQIVNFIITELKKIDAGVVSITGFSTAFEKGSSLTDSLRVLNFNREILAYASLRQIWWMSPDFVETFIRAVPDLDSWFILRLQLLEIIEAVPERAVIKEIDNIKVNTDDARKRSKYFLNRIKRSIKNGIQTKELLEPLILPAINALLEAKLVKEAKELNYYLKDKFGIVIDQLLTEVVAEKLGKSEYQSAVSLLNNLASFYYQQGEYQLAEPLYKQVLAINEKILAPDHPNTAASLNNLGNLFHSTGDYQQALFYYQQALQINEKVLGPEHPNTATSLNNLGALFRSMGDYQQALPYYQRALTIKEKVLGPDHPDTAISLNNWGFLFNSMGDYQQALPYFQRALTIKEKVLGPDHPDTAISLNNLGGLFDSMGDYQQALPYFQQALQINEKVLGPDHPDTITSLNNLAELYDDLGDHESAKLLRNRVTDNKKSSNEAS